MRQHQLSRDGRLLLVCAASSVRVYSAVTAELLFTLQGHSEEVTCLALHPANALEVRPGPHHVAHAMSAQYSSGKRTLRICIM